MSLRKYQFVETIQVSLFNGVSSVKLYSLVGFYSDTAE